MTTPPPTLLASLVEQATEWASVVREADKQWSEPLSTLLEALAAENGALIAEAKRLRGKLEAIDDAVINGRVCDDVAWFSKIETLHDFIEEALSPSPDAVVRDLFPATLERTPQP